MRRLVRPGWIYVPVLKHRLVSLWNRSQEAYVIEPLARIAQMIIVPVMQAAFTVVDEFTQTSRGEGGFGSTGHQ